MADGAWVAATMVTLQGLQMDYWPTAGGAPGSLRTTRSSYGVRVSLRGSRVMVLDLSARRILIVENEPLIVLNIAQALKLRPLAA